MNNHATKHNSHENYSPKMVKKLLPWMIAVALQPSLAQALEATALPTNGQVTAGAAAIAQNAGNMTINQSTQNVFINWDTFNVGAQASVNFVQPSASAMAINQVVTQSASQIAGQINANGQVVLLNPAGVVVTNGAVINAGSFVAAGQSGHNAEITDGQLRFMNTDKGGSVINQGQINAKEGGYVALVGATVNNSGQITAPGGTVALAAGQEVRLEITGNSLVGVKVDGAAVNASIDNSGIIAADGGKVIINSKQAAGALGAAINQTGTIRANSISTKNGEIWLDGGAGAVNVAGSVEAKGVNAGETGGKVVATGGAVTVTGTVDASGAAGGGQVYVGGGWQGKDPAINEAKTVTIAKDAFVKADATANGNGGTVVAWSADHTNVQGTISTKGAGTGKGGNVETSAKNLLGVSGVVDISSENGRGGYWLLDPTSVTVNGSADPIGGTTVGASSIETALNLGGTVEIQSDTFITFNENVSKTDGADSSLILNAGTNITISSGKTLSSIRNKLNIDFGTGSATTGTIEILGSIATNGGNVTFYKDAKLSSATPISTKITETSNGISGNVHFTKDLYLAAPGYSVTVDTTGAETTGYTGSGGFIRIDGSVYSAAPASLSEWPQALTLSTGGVIAGAITLGDAVGDSIGGTGNAALKSLTLSGPDTVTLNAATMNFLSTSGSIITASATTTNTPKIILNAANTTINVKGGTVQGVTGYTDYVQSTYDIVAKSGSTNQSFVINSDRSIKINNRSIDGTGILNNHTGKLDVILNPFVAIGATGGAIITNGATIKTNGDRKSVV